MWHRLMYIVPRKVHVVDGQGFAPNQSLSGQYIPFIWPRGQMCPQSSAGALREHTDRLITGEQTMPSDTSENIIEHGYTVVFRQQAPDEWQVIVPALPEIVTHGRDLDEAREMARDAIRCVLESAHKRGEQLPDDSAQSTERIAVTLP